MTQASVFDCLLQVLVAGTLLSPDKNPALPSLAYVDKIDETGVTIQYRGESVFFLDIQKSSWVRSEDQTWKKLL